MILDGYSTWIGGQRDSDEREYFWINGEPFFRGYQNWFQRQPKYGINNVVNLGAIGSDGNGQWYDAPSYIRRHFLCEIDYQ